jgi:hypothetical protein
MAIKKHKFNYKKSGVFSLLTFFILSFSSCATKVENPPPPDLIDKKEMTNIIIDLSISEAALTGEPLASFNDTLRKVNVLKEHNITKEHFLSSFKYYTENPAVLKEIYDSVAVSIERKKGL